MKELNRSSGKKPSETIDTPFQTCDKTVNQFRKNSYRIPEFDSGRLIPNMRDWAKLAHEAEGEITLNAAIEKLETSYSESSAISEITPAPLSSIDAFELAAIVAEAILMNHSFSVFSQAVSMAKLDISNKIISEIASEFVTNEINVVLIEPPINLADRLREIFNRYDWMDPSVLTMAADAATIASHMRRFLHSKADTMGSKNQDGRSLRKLASVYQYPRGLILENNNSFVRITYREWFNQETRLTTKSRLKALSHRKL